MKKFILSLTALLCAAGLHAQTFSAATQQSQADLQNVLNQYAALQKEIAAEKVPLSRKLQEVELEATEKTKEKDRQQSLSDNAGFTLTSLQDSVKKLKDNNAYMSNLLNDYINRFNTQLDQSETPLYKDAIDAALNAKENGGDPSVTFGLQMAVLEQSFDRLMKSIGGQTLRGDAIVGSGVKESGSFAVMGPIAFFASDTSSIAGVSYTESNSVQPHIYELDSKTGIRELIGNGSGLVMLDASQGEAQKFENEQDTLTEEIAKGGFVMWPILTLAGASLIIIVIKVIQFLGVKEAKQSDLSTIITALRDDRGEEALAYAKQIKGPVGELLQVAVSNADQDKEVIEEMLYEVIINNQPKLERLLTFISVTAAVGPLFGLLGTVTGMIRTFKMITVVGTGDAGSLSGGISEALITTKWGLIIAIPALLFHAMLARTARGVIGSMEQAAVGFINGIIDEE
ncbi:MAG: MotA/TolQ/ExbB proton channel family protein [Opitutales bacterium]|nr:MotA/TolQ/ExbB proton channel family protein [Opitutales bacterium]